MQENKVLQRQLETALQENAAYKTQLQELEVVLRDKFEAGEKIYLQIERLVTTQLQQREHHSTLAQQADEQLNDYLVQIKKILQDNAHLVPLSRLVPKTESCNVKEHEDQHGTIVKYENNVKELLDSIKKL